MNNSVNKLKYFFEKYYPTFNCNFYKGLVEGCYHFRFDYSGCFYLIDVMNDLVVLWRIKSPYGDFVYSKSFILLRVI